MYPTLIHRVFCFVLFCHASGINFYGLANTYMDKILQQVLFETSGKI